MNNEHRINSVYRSMKSRCYNEKDKGFKNYGGRGIKICDEWLNNYHLFRKWALSNGQAMGLEIDRINNDGNYEPSNCRFVTKQENGQNRRTTKLSYQDVHDIADKVKEGMSQTSVAIEYGVSQSNISQILNKKRWKAIDDPNEELHRPA